jgi:2-methylaconitate cis-trans-isomerase PrpF
MSPQVKIPATYMRGGTSKGVFFRLQDLPEPASNPGARATSCCCA